MLIIAFLVSVLVICAGIFIFATQTAASVLSSVATVSPTLSADGRSIILPSVQEGYTISINGTSNESVIDVNGNVYTPLVDTTVKVNYKVTKIEDGTTAVDQYKEAAIVISGKYKSEPSDNAEPAVLPKLQEWKGGNGTVGVTASSRIVVFHEEFMPKAVLIGEYLADIMGTPLEITSDAPKAGDIVIGYTDAAELGNEGYTVELSDCITIEAYSATGALYGGTTVAQMLSLYEGYELPRGYIRDYPAYAVRATMIDVARHYVPLDYLSEMSKYLAYFKVNQIHVHINDNSGQQNYAFRVESKRYPEINSSLGDNVYSQEEYRAYQTELLKYGVKVITEIDSPGHAGFAGLYDPSLVISSAKGNLDLTSNYNGVMTFMKGLVDEFVNGYDGNPSVIIDEIDTIHLGMDEYTYDHAQYKKYMKEICDYAKSLGKRVQLWSALKTSDFAEELPVSAEDVLINYWGDADMKAYVEAGFCGISNHSELLYIVPGATAYFGDSIDVAALYEKYKANIISAEITLAESSPLLMGVEGTLWNDINRGTSKEGIFDRIRDQMLLISEKAWHGAAKDVSGAQFEARLRAIQNLVPLVNPQSFVPSDENGVIAEYDFDKVENGKVKDTAQGLDATLNGLSVNGSKLTLDGVGYLSLPIKQVGFPYTVSLGLTYSSTTSGVLFAGGDTTFWLNANGDGKITFTRELHSYAFDFVFDKNIHYDIMLLCTDKTLSLYVDGVYVEDAHVISMATENQNFNSVIFSDAVLSTARIGEGIVGTVDSLRILGAADSDEFSGLEGIGYGNVALGKDTTASGTEVDYKWGPENAVDGMTTQSRDFKVSLNRADDAWLTIDLGKVYSIDKIKIYFVEAPAAYKILVSQDGVSYTEIYYQPSAASAKKTIDVIELDEAVGARYVKYQQVKMFTVTWGSYSGNFSEIEVFGSEAAIDKNLALGKEVIECTYNEVGTNGVPEDLTDGDKVLDWGKRVCFENRDTFYFTIDLEGECLIEGVNIYWYQKPNKYQIYVSSDGSNWTLAYEDLKDNGGAKVTDYVSMPGNVIARYVRVMQIERFTFSDGNRYSGNLVEVEVIGTETDIDALNEIDNYLETLSGDEKDHLYNRVALTKRIISTGNTELSALAVKLLYEEYERMKSSSYTLNTAKDDLYKALLDIKERQHASSDAAYDEYVLAYKFALSVYMNSGSASATRTNRLSLLNAAKRVIAKPDGATASFEINNISAIIDGNTSAYVTAVNTQAIGDSITLTYNDPITFTSLRSVLSTAFSAARVEISTDGTTFTPLREIDGNGNMRDLRFGLGSKNMCEIILTKPIENVVAIRITVTAAQATKLKISEIIINENTDINVIVPGASSYSLERYTDISGYVFGAFYLSDAVSREYLNNVYAYISYLVPKGETKAISAKISALEALDSSLYTEASFAALNAAISEAQRFVNSFNGNVSVYESDKALAALIRAEEALVRKSALDTSALENAIASASVNSWEYTYYSYKSLERAVDHAVALLGRANVTQAMIDEACRRVTSAVSSLEVRGARTNVALNKTLIVSGRESSTSLGPELAVDGNLNTRFSPNRKDGAYFIVDLGEILMIDGLEIVWHSTPRKYNIQISLDNVNYVTVYEAYTDTSTGGAKITEVVNFDGAKEARYVKFELVSRFTGGTPDTHALYSASPYEVMIYSSDMTPTKSELQYLVDLYEGGISDALNADCKAKIEEALAKAQTVLNSSTATAEEIESLVKLLCHNTDAIKFVYDNDSVHTHTCPCGVTVSEEHTFDEGKVIFAPTAREEGEMLYTCSVCGGTKTEAIPTVDLYLYSMKLNLAESVNVVFVAEVKEGLCDPYLIVELLGKTYKLTNYSVRADGRYEFVFRGATPANMTDVMNATLYAKSGDERVSSEERSFTIRDYCSAILTAYSADIKLRTLISDILVYGAALQQYANHAVDDLAISSVPRLTQSTYDETITDKLLISGISDGNKWISASLVCTGRMSIDLTFECISPEDTAVRISVGGREVVYNVSELEANEDGTYSIRFRGIMAYEFDKTIKAEFIKDGEASGEVLNYSVNSYIKYTNELYASSEESSERKLAELVRAIFCYGKSAEAYYNSVIGEK